MGSICRDFCFQVYGPSITELLKLAKKKKNKQNKIKNELDPMRYGPKNIVHWRF